MRSTVRTPSDGASGDVFDCDFGLMGLTRTGGGGMDHTASRIGAATCTMTSREQSMCARHLDRTWCDSLRRVLHGSVDEMVVLCVVWSWCCVVELSCCGCAQRADSQRHRTTETNG
jgi:hypothetical protein